MDPLRHPDLVEISRTLRNQLDMVLAAEQSAARVTIQRRRTLRDRFLEAEDRGERAHLQLQGGGLASGVVIGVGADHLVLVDDDIEHFIHLDRIASSAFPS